MGNPLNSVLKYIDPIGNAAGNALSGPHGILTPKQAPAPPGYNPANGVGTQLYPQPPGGPPSAPGGAPSGSGLFGAPQVPRGYAPNPWQQSPPSTTGNAWLGRGGSSSTPTPMGQSNPGAYQPGMGPPQVASGNQGMPPGGPQNQQQAIVQALRGGPQMRTFR
jgi:hypothetical protein